MICTGIDLFNYTITGTIHTGYHIKSIHHLLSGVEDKIIMDDEISSDWVPVNDTIFKEDKVKKKLIFSVAWNVQHAKVK